MREIHVTDILMCRQFLAPVFIEAKAIMGQIAHENIYELPEFKECEKEYEISVTLRDNVVLKGRIDIACLKTHTLYEIKPYTSDRKKLKRYTLQLQLYGNMYNRLYGVVPSLYLVLYGEGIVKQWVWYTDVLRKLEPIIVDMARLMEIGTLYIRNPFCNVCLRRTACPLYMKYPNRKILFVREGGGTWSGAKSSQR